MNFNQQYAFTKDQSLSTLQNQSAMPQLIFRLLSIWVLILLPLKFGQIISYDSGSFVQITDIFGFLIESWGSSSLLLCSSLLLLSPRMYSWKKLNRALLVLPLFLLALLMYCTPSDEAEYAMRFSLYIAGVAACVFYILLNLEELDDALPVLILISFIIILLIGTHQYLWGFDSTIDFIKNNPKYDQRVLSRLEQRLVSANFTYSNHFASYWILVGPLCFFTLYRLLDQNKYRFFRPYLVGIFVVVALALLFLSKSRAGILSIFLASALCVIFSSKKKNLSICLLSLLLITTFLMGYYGNMGSLWARLEYYQVGLAMFAENPFGVNGMGEFFPYYAKHKAENAEMTRYPHSLFISLLSQTGIYGISLFLYFVYKMSQNIKENWQDIETKVIATGCFAWLVHANLDFNFNIPAAFTMFCLLSVYAGRKSLMKSKEEKASLKATTIIFCFAFLALYLSAKQCHREHKMSTQKEIRGHKQT